MFQWHKAVKSESWLGAYFCILAPVNIGLKQKNPETDCSICFMFWIERVSDLTRIYMTLPCSGGRLRNYFLTPCWLTYLFFVNRLQHKEQQQDITMQAHELFRHLRMPELGDVRQYVRTLPTNTLMGFGAFAALTTYWYATRPKALKPPCDLAMQSVEVEVSSALVSIFCCLFCRGWALDKCARLHAITLTQS